MHNRRLTRQRIRNANRPIDTMYVMGELQNWSSTLPESPRNRYLRDHLFSKLNDPSICDPLTRRNNAIEKWIATEARNESTNQRLTSPLGEVEATWVRFLRTFFARVLGDVPSERIFERGSFSGGASTSRSRASSHPTAKYIGRADITSEALDLFQEFLTPVWENYSLWEDYSPIHIHVVPGNVMFTVPKTSHIDRVACKEPDLNMYMQKAVGSEIRIRLRRHGINLNDQSINAKLARQASIDGTLATIDLSSASDSVTTSLCELLLPELWYSLLMALRSPTTEIDGVLHVNEMMSSMGNGFTFELESLLFLGIARCACYFTGSKGVVSIYGDDIICPVEATGLLSEMLSFFGFTLNESKSFWEGPFRESCGGHFYNGCDITPFYLKNLPTTVSDLILLLNQIRRWAGLDGIGVLNPEAYDIWYKLSKLVPQVLWCGNDLSSRVSLCTPGLPRKRLASNVRSVRSHVDCTEVTTEIGRYLFALDSESPVSVTRISPVMRYRRNPESWDGVDALFHEEINS